MGLSFLHRVGNNKSLKMGGTLFPREEEEKSRVEAFSFFSFFMEFRFTEGSFSDSHEFSKKKGLHIAVKGSQVRDGLRDTRTKIPTDTRWGETEFCLFLF